MPETACHRIGGVKHGNIGTFKLRQPGSSAVAARPQEDDTLRAAIAQADYLLCLTICSGTRDHHCANLGLIDHGVHDLWKGGTIGIARNGSGISGPANTLQHTVDGMTRLVAEWGTS